MARAVFNRLVDSFVTSTLTKMETKAKSTHLKWAVQKEERASFQGLVLIPGRWECFTRSGKADLESRPCSNIARKQLWNSGRWSSVWLLCRGLMFLLWTNYLGLELGNVATLGLRDGGSEGSRFESQPLSTFLQDMLSVDINTGLTVVRCLAPPLNTHSCSKVSW